MTSQLAKFTGTYPLACRYVQFDSVYTHYAAVLDEVGKYVNVPANVCQPGHNPEALFIPMARDLIASGDSFFLNEYVHAVNNRSRTDYSSTWTSRFLTRRWMISPLRCRNDHWAVPPASLS